MSWTRRILLASAALLLFGLLFWRTTASWVLDGLIMLRHPQVETTAVVPADALLLDVRPASEFAVSHLDGARQIDPNAPTTVLGDTPKDQLIVTYCSVGARSAAFAERLGQAGFTRVLNLRGSLFRWVRQGRPLVNAAGPTKRVHPYNDRWGMLIDEEYRAYVP